MNDHDAVAEEVLRNQAGWMRGATPEHQARLSVLLTGVLKVKLPIALMRHIGQHVAGLTANSFDCFWIEASEPNRRDVVSCDIVLPEIGAAVIVRALWDLGQLIKADTLDALYSDPLVVDDASVDLLARALTRDFLVQSRRYVPRNC